MRVPQQLNFWAKTQPEPSETDRPWENKKAQVEDMNQVEAASDDMNCCFRYQGGWGPWATTCLSGSHLGQGAPRFPRERPLPQTALEVHQPGPTTEFSSYTHS